MLLLFICVVILGFIFPKAKLVTFLQIALCTIIFSFNTDNPDYSGYLGTYYSVSEGGIYRQYFNRYGYLYKSICDIFNMVGLSFNQFRFIVFIVSMFLVLNTIDKLTNRKNFVLSLYMIFPFVMDCIQIRNFIAEAIIFYAFRYLILFDISKSNNSIVKFIACIVIATSFHHISIFYLLFLTALLKYKFKTVLIVEIIGSILITLFIRRFSIYGITDNISYIKKSVSLLTFFFLSGITILLIFSLCYYARKRNIESYLNKQITQQLIHIILTCVVFLPILIFHYDVYRFIRITLFIFSAFAGYYIQNVQEKYAHKYTITLSAISIFTIFSTCYGLLLYRSAYYAYDISLLEQILNSLVIAW